MDLPSSVLEFEKEDTFKDWTRLFRIVFMIGRHATQATSFEWTLRSCCWLLHILLLTAVVILFSIPSMDRLTALLFGQAAASSC
jgi:hypothetical protein